MPQPCLQLQHLKTSKQLDGDGQPMIRYWFQWSDRKALSNVVVRLTLTDSDGNKVTEASIKLPKVTINGYLPKDDNGVQQPIYDSSVWIQLDDIVRDKLPTSFSYYTLEGLFKKSDVVTGEMSGKFDDITSQG